MILLNHVHTIAIKEITADLFPLLIEVDSSQLLALLKDCFPLATDTGMVMKILNTT